jgi:hypothetical protein
MAGSYFFKIVAGEDFDHTMTWLDDDGNPVSLVGYTGAEFNILANEASLLSVTTTPNSNGSVITLGGAAGTVEVFIAAADTAIGAFDNCQYILLLTSAVPRTFALLYGPFAREGIS